MEINARPPAPLTPEQLSALAKGAHEDMKQHFANLILDGPQKLPDYPDLSAKMEVESTKTEVVAKKTPPPVPSKPDKARIDALLGRGPEKAPLETFEKKLQGYIQRGTPLSIEERKQIDKEYAARATDLAQPGAPSSVTAELDKLYLQFNQAMMRQQIKANTEASRKTLEEIPPEPTQEGPRERRIGIGESERLKLYRGPIKRAAKTYVSSSKAEKIRKRRTVSDGHDALKNISANRRGSAPAAREAENVKKITFLKGLKNIFKISHKKVAEGG